MKPNRLQVISRIKMGVRVCFGLSLSIIKYDDFVAARKCGECDKFTIDDSGVQWFCGLLLLQLVFTPHDVEDVVLALMIG